MNPLTAYFRLTVYGLRAFSRDRSALGWSFALPILLVLVFGLLFHDFGKPEAIRYSIGLVLPESSDAGQTTIKEAFSQISLFEVSFGSEREEKQALQAGKRRAVLVFPPDFSARLMLGQSTPVRILYDPTEPESVTQPVRGALRQAVQAMERQILSIPSLLEPKEEPVAPSLSVIREPRPLHYILPGLFAATAMHLGLFTAIPLIALREQGILRRLATTPVPSAVVLLSQVTQRLIVAIVQALLLLLVGRVVFGFAMVCSPLVILPVLLLGVGIFIAVGISLAAVAKTQDAGMSLIQVVNLPLLLLSGLLIPAELLPASLKPLMLALPTTYLGDALRQLMLGYSGMHLFSYNLGVLVLWLFGTLILAQVITRR